MTSGGALATWTGGDLFPIPSFFLTKEGSTRWSLGGFRTPPPTPWAKERRGLGAAASVLLVDFRGRFPCDPQAGHRVRTRSPFMDRAPRLAHEARDSVITLRCPAASTWSSCALGALRVRNFLGRNLWGRLPEAPDAAGLCREVLAYLFPRRCCSAAGYGTADSQCFRFQPHPVWPSLSLLLPGPPKGTHVEGQQRACAGNTVSECTINL